MIIATILNQRTFKSYEYLCALCICSGLVLFALADYTLDPLQFVPTGLLLVSGSVVADAILPNAQEHLFHEGSSRLEVTVYSNLFSFIVMTVVTLGNGSLIPFFRGISADSTLAVYFAIYTVLSYISISCYMTLVKRFGGVTAVVLTTARKAMTLVLSFLLFPKGFSWLYVYGSLLVLGSVMIAGICKKLISNVPPAQSSEKDYSLEYRSVPKQEPRSKKGWGKSSSSRSNDYDDNSSVCSEGTYSSILDDASAPLDTSAATSAEAVLHRISRQSYM